MFGGMGIECSRGLQKAAGMLVEKRSENYADVIGYISTKIWIQDVSFKKSTHLSHMIYKNLQRPGKANIISRFQSYPWN